jgi:hypothetical protein
MMESLMMSSSGFGTLAKVRGRPYMFGAILVPEFPVREPERVALSRKRGTAAACPPVATF